MSVIGVNHDVCFPLQATAAAAQEAPAGPPVTIIGAVTLRRDPGNTDSFANILEAMVPAMERMISEYGSHRRLNRENLGIRVVFEFTDIHGREIEIRFTYSEGGLEPARKAALRADQLYEELAGSDAAQLEMVHLEYVEKEWLYRYRQTVVRENVVAALAGAVAVAGIGTSIWLATRKPEEYSAASRVSPLARYGFLAAFGGIALAVGVSGIYSTVITRSESSEIGTVIQGIWDDQERVRPYLDWDAPRDDSSTTFVMGVRGRFSLL